MEKSINPKAVSESWHELTIGADGKDTRIA
jgi:hypothetical protein